jgi:hypothetical protein
LEMAWGEVLSRLLRDGFQVTAVSVPSRSEEKRRAFSRPHLGIFISLLPSFLIFKPCCLVPVLWSLFGGSVGILHLFAPLEPYRLLFMLASLGLLGSAFYQLYLRPPTFSFGENRDSVLTSRVLFWIASSLFIGATLSPLLLPHGF